MATMRAAWRGAVLACATAAALAPGLLSAADSWQTGRALDRVLAAPAALEWDARALRDALRSVSQAHRVAILLDRRVDPEQPVTQTIAEQPLQAALAALADGLDLDVKRVDSVLVFGPREALHTLRTAAALRQAEAQRAPAALRKKLLRRVAWRWDDLAEPRELLADLAQEAGLSCDADADVPHDLWAAHDLPALTWSDRVTLLAVQFGCTYAIDGTALRLVPLPDRLTLRRTYDAEGDPAAQAAAWRELAPDCAIEVQGRQLVVEGLLEDHERLSGGEPPVGPATVAASDAEQRYTLNVQNVGLGRLLDELARRLQLEFRDVDASLKAAGQTREAIVSLQVKDASLDELLHAALDPLGLEFARAGRVVTLRDAP